VLRARTSIEKISMHYLLLRHKIEDFKHWKPVYDSHLPSRQRAGLRELHLFRNIDTPHEIIILFEASDLAKAHQFVASSDLREAMNRAGVTDKPEICFLDDRH
jgi:hypothetical protein